MGVPQLKQDVVLNVIGLNELKKLEKRLRKIQKKADKGVNVKVKTQTAATKQATQAEKELTTVTNKQNLAIQKSFRLSKNLADNRKRLNAVTLQDISLSHKKEAVLHNLNTLDARTQRAEIRKQQAILKQIRAEQALNAVKRKNLVTERTALLSTNELTVAEERLTAAKTRLAAATNLANVAQSKENIAAVAAAKLELQAATAAHRTTASVNAKTAALNANTIAQKRNNATFFHGVAGSAAVLGGSGRTMASGTAFHTKTLGLFGFFAGLAALRGIFSGIIAPTAKYEKQLASVRKTTKMSKEETEEYGEELLKLSSRLAIAREDLADVSIVAGQMGIRGKRNLLEFTETVATMSEVAEISVDRASAGIAQLAVSFNLPISAAGYMASALNELGNNTTANVAKILAALSKIGPAAELLGLTLAETSAMAATLIHAGLVPSRSGTSLRSILLDLQIKSEEIANVMKISGEEFKKGLEENTLPTIQRFFDDIKKLDRQQAETLENIFGRRHFVAVQILANKTDLLNKNIEIGNAGYADQAALLEEHARKVDNLATRWDRFAGAMGNWLTMIGGEISPTLSRLLDAMTPLSAQSGIWLENRREDLEAEIAGRDPMGEISPLFGMTGYDKETARITRQLEKVKDAQIDVNIETLNYEEISKRWDEVGVDIAKLRTEALKAEGKELKKINKDVEDLIALQDRLFAASLAEKEDQSLGSDEDDTDAVFDLSLNPELEREFERQLRDIDAIQLMEEENDELRKLKRERQRIMKEISETQKVMVQLPSDSFERGEIEAGLGTLHRILAGISDEIDNFDENKLKELQEEGRKLIQDHMEGVRQGFEADLLDPYIPDPDEIDIVAEGEKYMEMLDRLDALTPLEGLFREGTLEGARENLARARAEVERLAELRKQRPDDLELMDEYATAREKEADAEVAVFDAQQKRTADLSKNIVNVIRDLKTMAGAFGALGENANNFVSSVIVGIETVSQLVQELRQMDAAGQGLSFQAVSAGLGIATSLAGLAESIVKAIKADGERAREQREKAIRVSKENQRRLEESIKKLYEGDQVAPEVSGDLVEGLRSEFATLESAWLNIDPGSEWFIADPKEREQFETQYRLTKDRINALLEQMDVAPLDTSRGFAYWERNLNEIINDVLQNQGQYQESIQGLIASMNFLSNFVEMDVEESFARFMDGLGELESVPEWLLEALGGIDLSTDEGKELLKQLLSDWAEGITSGEIDFGGLTPNELEDIMSFLRGLADGEQAASDSIGGLIGSIQRLGKFMEIDAVEALNRFMLGLGEIEDVPDWMKEALAGLDLTTDEGRENLRKMLAEWAQQIDAGSLNLGGLSEDDVNSMMDFLQGLSDGDFGGESSINELSVSRSITDVQANAVVLLLEQMVFWQREMARKLGVDTEYVGSVGKKGPTEDLRDKIDLPPPVEFDWDGSPPVLHATYALMGDIAVQVAPDPDNPAFADAVGQAVAAKARRYGVRRI